MIILKIDFSNKVKMNNHTKFEEYISIFLATNAMFQFIVDIIIVEILSILPHRINHLSLTFLNAFISFKTLSAIKKDKFRFLHEDVQSLWTLELLLIIGDIYYLIEEWDEIFFYIRLTFIIFSSFDVVFLTFVMIKYELYHITYQGEITQEDMTNPSSLV